MLDSSHALHRVNLLPWRETKRAQHRRRFFGLVILSFLLAVGIQWGGGLYFSDQKSQQQARLTYLKQYIAQLDSKIDALDVVKQEHDSIMTRLDMVEKLQRGRNKTTELMNLIAQLIPEGVYVDKIKMNGQDLELSGISDSTARLATMLDNLERSSLLVDVEMHSIVLGKKRFGIDFQTFNVSFTFNLSEEKRETETDELVASQAKLGGSHG
ncbi:PilN domain-containing protein [Vibrio clamense]|uniref:PilN domain-containing protein n=1 Tax=Vibrio clamense TaxID=2910254 RepID=UPI003D22A9AA